MGARECHQGNCCWPLGVMQGDFMVEEVLAENEEPWSVWESLRTSGTSQPPLLFSHLKPLAHALWCHWARLRLRLVLFPWNPLPFTFFQPLSDSQGISEIMHVCFLDNLSPSQHPATLVTPESLRHWSLPHRTASIFLTQPRVRTFLAPAHKVAQAHLNLQ